MADKYGVPHIRLPDAIVEPMLANLITSTFPDFQEATLTGNVILAPTNDNVDELNDKVLKRMPGPERSFLSHDSVPVSDGELTVVTYCV